MQDRALFYIDQSDIPADAVAYYGETAESTAGNVIYVPCNQSFYLNHVGIVSAPDCEAAEIEGVTGAYYGDIRTGLYVSSGYDPANMGLFTGKHSKLGVVHGIIVNYSNNSCAYSFLPMSWSANSSSISNPSIVAIDKYVRIKFTDNVVLVKRWSGDTLLQHPIYITTETN